MKLLINAMRLKNKLLGVLTPDWMARRAAHRFLTPRRFPLKPWELAAETSCRRIAFGNGLSAARWGEGIQKILLMHGWESRATQMSTLAHSLAERGYEVTAIDGPRHGRSGGDRANPVAFADAVVAACRTLGPFYGAAGHSMGAAALAVAMASGASFNRSVLIASPARLEDNLNAFAAYMGLPPRSTRRFIRTVEQAVGRPVASLDVGAIFSRVKPDVLLIHDRDDQEVPYAALTAIRSAFPQARSYTTRRLGHRRIVHTPEVASQVGDFFRQPSLASMAEGALRLGVQTPTGHQMEDDCHEDNICHR